MKNYNILFLVFLSLILGNKAQTAQIVYPKTQTVTINSPVTFFIGNEKSGNELYINNEKVKVHPSGGFYHVVKLNNGENVFKIDNKTGDIQTFKIIRPAAAAKTETKLKYSDFSEPAVYQTNDDKSPLRNAPNDSGTSRLQNLQKNIPLNIIGYYGNFYKVKLAADDYAWIDKSYLTKNSGVDNSPANIISTELSENDSKIIYKVTLDKKVPYVVSEKRKFDIINEKYEPSSNGLDITLYNVNNFAEYKYDIGLTTENSLFGYKTYFTESNEFITEIKKLPQYNSKKPLSGIKIMLDPGHGGSEYGAIGCLGDKEKDINLAIALKTKPLLEKAGAAVYLTRNKDIDLGLYDRVKYSQTNNSDIFISIHANALPDSLAETYRSGTSTYYFHPQAAPLSRIMLETMTKELGTNNDKARQESFAVIRNPESVSILVEVGYMINPEDNAKLISPDFQQKVGLSILHGLERYINELNSEK